MPKRKVLRARRSQYLAEARRMKAEMRRETLDAGSAALIGAGDGDSRASPTPHSPAFPAPPVPSTATAATPVAAVPPSSSQPLPSKCALKESLLEKRTRILKKEEKIASIGDKVLVPVQQLQSLVENMRCPKKACKNVLQLNITTNYWDTTINVTCPLCNNQVCHLPQKTADTPTKEVISESNAIVVHQSIVNNDGFAGLRRLTASMGLKPMAKAVYKKYCSFLYKHMDEYMEMKRKDVFAPLKQVYAEEYGIHPDEDGILNIEVSFDASWMTRGHRSPLSISFVIEVNTGIVVDFETLCNICSICDGNDAKIDHLCQKNFDGDSGAMEPEAAVRMWSRSTQYNLRYVTFVGDGDSSSFKAVASLNNGNGPYEVPVVKEECINHVHKRMGNRLRKLKNEQVILVKTKTGKTIRRSILGGGNLLTDVVIRKLSSYYGKAIHDNLNKDAETMRKAILANFYHLTSSDDNPDHKFCPEGEESWCFYNRAKATGETPPSHASQKLYFAKLSIEHKDLIRNVYSDLSNLNLLSRCLKGRTQNPNESLHAKQWLKCSKNKYAGMQRVRYAAQNTMIEHNFGYTSSLLVHLFGTTSHYIKVLKTQDKERRSSKISQPRKKKRKTDKKECQDYQPGAF